MKEVAVMRPEGAASLSAKITGIILLMVVALSIAQALAYYAIGHAHVVDSLAQRENTIRERLRHSLGGPVYQFDHDSMAAIIRAEFLDAALVAVQVVQSDGKHLQAWIADGADVKRVDAQSVSGRAWSGTASLQAPDGKEIGQLRLQLDSGSALQVLLGETLVLWAVMTLVALAVALLFFIVLRRRLALPLADIHRGMADYEADVGVVETVQERLRGLGGFKELVELGQGCAELLGSVTERQRDIERSEMQLRITLNAIGDAVMATDAEGKVQNMNPVAEHLTGWSAKEAYGRSLRDVFRIVHADSRAPASDPVEKVLSTGSIVGLANHTVLIGKDGRERQIADSGAPIVDLSGRIVGVVLVFRDVTEQYRLEEQLRQAQKMESIGQLAGGIAHDFNNMLGAILGAVEILQMRLDGEQERLTKTIEEAASRSAELTQQLLLFSRKAPLDRQAIDVHEAVRRSVALLERAVDRSITIDVQLQAEQSVINGNLNHLEQVLMNLGVNARDAMSAAGGVLTIRSEVVHLRDDEMVAGAFDLQTGAYLRLTVNDTGCGMDEATQRRIFEPFFTTKGIGRGTGLGMSSVYGTIRDHDGGIELRSIVGQGSTFELYFPLLHDGAVVHEDDSEAEPVAGTGRLLVADDEEVVLRMVKELLHDLGYEITVAHDGQEAVDLYKAEGPFDLVIMDMIMPRLSGREACAAIRAIRPGQPILAATGYSTRQTLDDLRSIGVEHLIQKPYRIDNFSRMIAKVLQARS